VPTNSVRLSNTDEKMNGIDYFKLVRQIIWLAAVVVGAVFVVSAIEQKEASPVQGVFVNIEPLDKEDLLITNEDVLLTIDRSFGVPLAGMPIANINVARLERVLEEDPFILDANVFVDAKNYVNITIEQREPILRVIDNNGLNYYLDKHGFRMPLSKHFTARVLVVTGNLPPYTPDFLEIENHGLKDVFELANTLLEDEFFSAQIEQIFVSNTREIVLNPKVGDQKIMFGKYGDVEEKLDKLVTFYKQALPYEGWNKYKTINLKFKNQVVCEKR
jgi:cell division protein FtsQ